MLGTGSWLSEALQHPVGDAFLRDVLDSLHDGLYLVNADRRIVYWNYGAERITGYSAADAIGRLCEDEFLVHTDAAGEMLCRNGCPLAIALSTGRSRVTSAFCLHKSGYRVPILVRVIPILGPDGKAVGVAECFREQESDAGLREEVIKLAEAATTDPLTGLPNRRAFDESLDLAFYRFGRHGYPFGLIMLDLDHFKLVNDDYGHPVGDLVLQAVARTLTYVRRRDELAARWGGEEFTMLVQPVDGIDDVRSAALRVQQMIAAMRIPAGPHVVAVTVSAGATLVRPGDTPASIIVRVDELLYESKLAGRNSVTSG